MDRSCRFFKKFQFEPWKAYIPYAKEMGDSLDLSLVLQHMAKMGADLTNEDGTKAAFNTEEGGLHTFKYFTNLFQNDLIPRQAVTGDQHDTIDMYQAGEVGFFAGSNFVTQIEENAPDVYDQTFASQSITGKSGNVTLSVMAFNYYE